MARIETVVAHTAGPWIVESSYDTHFISSRVNPFEDFRVAKIRAYYPATDATLTEAAANARLISAAPDLLLACKAALNDRMFKDWPGIATLLMDAIAKAEGPT